MECSLEFTNSLDLNRMNAKWYRQDTPYHSTPPYAISFENSRKPRTLPTLSQQRLPTRYGSRAAIRVVSPPRVTCDNVLSTVTPTEGRISFPTWLPSGRQHIQSLIFGLPQPRPRPARERGRCLVKRLIRAASRGLGVSRSVWTASLCIYHSGKGGHLERGVRKYECPPHVRDGAIVVPEPFLRLFEVTTDDVDERIDRDLHCRIESVDVVHSDHARVHV